MKGNSMKTVKEIAAFIDAYNQVIAAVPRQDVDVITSLKALDYDESEIAIRFPEAASVLDAYHLWGAARSYNEEGNGHEAS
jgi:hypothetical protein